VSPWCRPGVALVALVAWCRPGRLVSPWCRPGVALVALVANKIDTLSGPAYKRAMPDKPGRTN